MTIDPDILLIFLAEVDGYLTTLGRDEANVEERRRAAHGLKGAASMLGLEQLRGCGVGLEEALAEDDLPRVREELARATRLVEALRPTEGTRAAAAPAPDREGSGSTAFDEEWDPETARMLRRLFAEEANDHLDAIAGALSRMGRAPTRGELEEMLRKAHTLKGSASTVGLQRIGEAAHRFEETLIELRDGVRAVDEALLDRLLAAVDLLRSMVEAEGSDAAIGELLERFTTTLRELPAEAPPRREPQALEPLPAEDAPPLLLPDRIDRRIGDRRGSERRFEEQRVRVDVKKLDALQNAVGELVIDRTRVERRVEELRGLARDLSISRRALHTALGDLRGASEPAVLRLREVDTEVADAVVSLERATAALSEDSEALRRSTRALLDTISQLRMMPIHWLHARLQRPLRGMARSQGKLVELFIDDESSEMDRSTAEQITDSLLQLVRNAVAHGIESPADRALRGKPPVGRVRISARHQSDFVSIDVEDDGGGIDPAELRRTLLEQRRLPASAVEALGEGDLLDHIFDPGFSTRARADRLAGRGVGLDLVRQNVSELGGSVQVRSRLGIGTRFTLQLPMTTSIAQALLFKVGEPVYALPVSHVVETVYADPAELRDDPALGHQVLTRRGWLPLLHLHDLLGGDSPLPLQRTRNPAASLARQAVIVIQVGELRFGATCTRVIGPREIVLKPLGCLLSGLSLFAGATISGSSKVQFVLDAAMLARLALAGARPPQLEAAPTTEVEEPRILLADDSRAVREALAHILRGAGYSVDTAADGWEAWERLQLRAYDLLVTDLEMPGLHGYELLGRCRGSAGLVAMPVLVLTSRTAERNRQAALERGASAFVAKPINRRVLLDQIQTLIRR